MQEDMGKRRGTEGIDMGQYGTRLDDVDWNLYGNLSIYGVWPNEYLEYVIISVTARGE